MRTPLCAVTAVLVMLVALARPAGAQEPADWDSREARVTRPALEALRDRYQRAASSPAYSPVLRAEAQEQADLIATRLEQGDFRPGDNLLVEVEQHPALSDTFSVTSDRTILLPDGVGPVALAGLLRSEVEGAVSTAVARMIRDARVRARSLIRVSIEGAVQTPGFYRFDSDTPLSEVLMRAGGQASNADIDAVRIERGAVTIADGERMAAAFSAGLTVDQIGLREGDRLIVPEQSGAFLSAARDLLLVVPALVGLIAIIG